MSPQLDPLADRATEDVKARLTALTHLVTRVFLPKPEWIAELGYVIHRHLYYTLGRTAPRAWNQGHSLPISRTPTRATGHEMVRQLQLVLDVAVKIYRTSLSS